MLFLRLCQSVSQSVRPTFFLFSSWQISDILTSLWYYNTNACITMLEQDFHFLDSNFRLPKNDWIVRIFPLLNPCTDFFCFYAWNFSFAKKCTSPYARVRTSRIHCLHEKELCFAILVMSDPTVDLFNSRSVSSSANFGFLIGVLLHLWPAWAVFVQL